MQMHRLNETQVAEVQKFLATWYLNRGPAILGSQLGTALVNVLETPVRDLGGLRFLVEQELSSLLTIAGTEPDLHFTIRPDVVASPAAAEVAQGQELLRQFSNPRLEGSIGVNAEGDIALGSERRPLPEGFKPIAKPTVQEFRDLAKQFLDAQPSELQPELLRAWEGEDYAEWVRTLRQLATPQHNLIRSWEAVRSEFVTRKLVDELLHAGLSSIKAAEIAAKARSTKPKVQATTQRTPEKIRFERRPGGDDAFRDAVHAAIDAMSMDELRRLPISAGLMFDASR